VQGFRTQGHWKFVEIFATLFGNLILEIVECIKQVSVLFGFQFLQVIL